MKYVTFVFSEPIGTKFPIYSWLIKKYENTNYSHVSMHFFSASIARNIIYEAVGAGVRFICKNMWDQHAHPVFQFKVQVTEQQYVRLLQHCVDTAGMGYGIKLAFGMFLAKTFKLKKNPFPNPTQKVCSTAIGELLVELGYKFDKELDLLDPKDIFYALGKGSNG